MRQITQIAAWWLLLTFSSHCYTQNTGTILEGNIQTAEGWRPKVYLVYPSNFRQILSPYEGIVVDSCNLSSDGHFSFGQKAWLQKAQLCLLFVQPEHSRYPNDIVFPLLPENFICLVLEPGKTVQLEAQADSLAASYTLRSGSSDNQLLAQLRNLRRPVYLEMARQAATPQEDSTVVFQHGSPAEAAYTQQLYQFLDTCQAYYPTLAAIRYAHTDNEYRDNPELFVKLCQRLSEQQSDNPLSAQYCAYTSPEHLPVLIGEKVPDYALPGPDGDTLRLSELKGELILLDFWASWCAPCRKEIRETLVPLYAAYHEKGFEIAGISIDSSPEAWRRAIARDGATWPTGCDMEGDASPVRQDLKFEYIPGNYLMDSNGVLLARNLHGDSLRAFVRAYLDGK
ncbi:MAG: TlpA family protein disulfide reductase [Lewinellaceae bacterium]|nr:TlpA family protein disulfide reductase [Lewinellaceae bacterium]